MEINNNIPVLSHKIKESNIKKLPRQLTKKEMRRFPESLFFVYKEENIIDQAKQPNNEKRAKVAICFISG